jgi:hypothetical protein
MTMLELLIRLEGEAGLIDIYQDEDQVIVKTFYPLTRSLENELHLLKDRLLPLLPKKKQSRPGMDAVDVIILEIA